MNIHTYFMHSVHVVLYTYNFPEEKELEKELGQTSSDSENGFAARAKFLDMYQRTVCSVRTMRQMPPMQQ